MAAGLILTKKIKLLFKENKLKESLNIEMTRN